MKVSVISAIQVHSSPQVEFHRQKNAHIVNLENIKQVKEWQMIPTVLYVIKAHIYPDLVHLDRIYVNIADRASIRQAMDLRLNWTAKCAMLEHTDRE